MELAPSVKDAATEPYVKICFAMICAWTGERELALGQLEAFTKTPGSHTYGNLRLSPMWDPLRGDPRFEKIVASLSAERNCFQITARVFSVTQIWHMLRVSIELAINQLANKTRQLGEQLAVKVRHNPTRE